MAKRRGNGVTRDITLQEGIDFFSSAGMDVRVIGFDDDDMKAKPKEPEVEVFAQMRGGKTHYSFLPFGLPEGVSGDFRIETQIAPKGSELTVVSYRNAIFMGLKHTKVKLTHDVEIHNLLDEDGVWMTTRPQELEQVTRQLQRAHGNVLVGGLGLGLAVAVLDRNPKVTGIWVIEESEDVIKLVKPYLPVGKTMVIQADLYQYLKDAQHTQPRTTFDFAFYDTWRGTGQYVWRTEVKPLRRLSDGIIPHDMIECWNEDEMIGQIAMSIDTWIGLGREVVREMMIKQIGKAPKDMTKKEFYDFGQYNQEAYPFLAWLHDVGHIMPAEGQQLAAAQYLRDLKDYRAYQAVWEKYETYGKDEA